MSEFPLGTYAECYRGETKDNEPHDGRICLPIRRLRVPSSRG